MTYFDLSITFTSSDICPFYDVKVPGIKFGKEIFIYYPNEFTGGHPLQLVQEGHLNYSFYLQLISNNIFKWAIFYHTLS